VPLVGEPSGEVVVRWVIREDLRRVLWDEVELSCILVWHMMNWWWIEWALLGRDYNFKRFGGRTVRRTHLHFENQKYCHCKFQVIIHLHPWFFSFTCCAHIGDAHVI
jgi:hypothetical protein